VRSLHGTPKPLAASSASNLLDRQHDLRPLRLSSGSSDEGDSSLEECGDDGLEECGDDGLEECGDDGFVLKEREYFAKFEQEQKVNFEVLKRGDTLR
jgi:hypothetical protein